MKQINQSIIILVLNLLLFQTASANNAAISNITLTGQNTISDFTLIQFDITWDNSWRVSSGPTNYDAAWIFAKFSTDGGATWSHATIATSGHTVPSGSTIKTPFEKKGVFIYRSSVGAGTVNFTGVQLKWEYGTDGVGDADIVAIKVFAIEMVYVPTGEFAAGSGGSETSAFTLTTINTGNATTAPSGVGSLGGEAGGYPTNEVSPANSSWPNGFEESYVMKYEISQEQYRDFLNCLTYGQQLFRTAISPDGSAGSGALSIGNLNRQGIDIQIPGVASTTPALYACNLDGDGTYNEPEDGQTLACNFLSWTDGTAYADWAAMRPMTELEFEKACRGNQSPVADEFAWGTSSIAASAYTLQNVGAINEGIATNYATTSGVGNASYITTDGAINGPLRVGIFAGNANNTSDNRVRSGGSFYGIMELSGNLRERPVTIGTFQGRNFSGIHGDGSLDSNGNANVPNWPIGATGAGFRGGSFNDASANEEVSDREMASLLSTTRNDVYGFRCVRECPSGGCF